MIFDSILEVIGNTPIVRLNRLDIEFRIEAYAKLEFTNPGGSIKDRIGYWLIEDAERKGLIKPGGVIIESTGGNTGIGLAMAAIVKGYKCIFTIPDKMSEVKINCLKAFGAQVVVTPTDVEADDPRSYYSIAKKLARETPNSLYIDQYNNLANIEYHYLHTGPEILKQMPDIDILVAGIGSGGTICGAGKFLKEHRPNIKIIAIDPEGSIVFDTFNFGKEKSPFHSYLVEGIGKEFIPRNYDFKQLDDIIKVRDQDAFLMTKKLLRSEGIFAGGSSGAATYGALTWARAHRSAVIGKKMLIIFPDGGSKYISKLYDDKWMINNGFKALP